jgi:hypothetical protein
VARWSEIQSEAADLTSAVEMRFAANRHHVLATVRPDGSPRVSGTEVYFHAGELWLGCMPGSGKATDLARDPRMALHTAPVDIELAEGDVTIDGRVERSRDLDVWAAITGQDRGDVTELGGALFRVDVTLLRLVQVQDERLVVHRWRPGKGVRRTEFS